MSFISDKRCNRFLTGAILSPEKFVERVVFSLDKLCR